MIDDEGNLKGTNTFLLSDLVTVMRNEYSLPIYFQEDSQQKIFCNCSINWKLLGAGNFTEFHINFKGVDIKNIDLFSKSDPYLMIYRPGTGFLTERDGSKVSPESWILLVQTEYV